MARACSSAHGRCNVLRRSTTSHSGDYATTGHMTKSTQSVDYMAMGTCQPLTLTKTADELEHDGVTSCSGSCCRRTRRNHTPTSAPPGARITHSNSPWGERNRRVPSRRHVGGAPGVATDLQPPLRRGAPAASNRDARAMLRRLSASAERSVSSLEGCRGRPPDRQTGTGYPLCEDVSTQAKTRAALASPPRDLVERPTATAKGAGTSYLPRAERRRAARLSGRTC
jgi:hypothetical protein